MHALLGAAGYHLRAADPAAMKVLPQLAHVHTSRTCQLDALPFAYAQRPGCRRPNKGQLL